MDNNLYNKIIEDNSTRPFWGQELLRDVLLNDLLGNDTHSIMYWAGKKIARKYPLKDALDIVLFFKQAGLGDLTIESENKYEIKWTLSGDIVAKRIEANPDADFMFEAGFLAQITQQQFKVISEAEMNPKEEKNGTVLIRVHMDPKNPAPVIEEEIKTFDLKQ
ncbi:MAG: YslB family protein [Apilactobacillus sp.]|uniref:YslB family protein n=1 Tax=Apilactobacillus TaxID=2767877 RepID=UPI0025D76EE4|nr:YslB family protein [Apilactobacillus sp.]MCT6822794.1 YslB family protein [Apilactobacillus sp.]MCT6857858.1 YslB family protein [Apilactobacillus sp.]